jgi:hypothetical protein
MSQTPNPIKYLINNPNQDFRNIGEDLIDFLLKDIDGLLIGIPNTNHTISLYYYGTDKLKNILKLPGMTINPKTKESKSIRFSSKLLKLDSSNFITQKGLLRFPNISQQEYSEFLIGTDKTKEILDLFNTLGQKYGINRLGDNIPQDIIRNLSQNEKFKIDIGRILK